MIIWSKVNLKIKQDWIRLNPKGFHYGSGGDKKEYVDINKKEQKYFVSHYSMIDCCGDRSLL